MRKPSLPKTTATPDAVTILGLDGSTDITGVALIRCRADGFDVLAVDALDATHAPELGTAARRPDIQARLARIRWTRGKLASFLSWTRYTFDLVAYETDTERGHSATEALKWATGNYLTLSAFAGFKPYPVTRQAACIASDTLAVYRQSRGVTTAEQNAKKARMKAAVLAWAVAEFPDFAAQWGDKPLPEQEAIADALAVCVAAYKALYAPAKKKKAAPRRIATKGKS